MTYGVRDADYISEVDLYLKGVNISGYIILKDYMNGEECARLNCVTDVFVHAQTTDAFSASVQEFLYAGKLVLNPSWIRYDEHEERGIFYLKYDSFDLLDECINSAIVGLSCGMYKSKLEKNREILHDFTSWEVVTPSWRRLYEKGEKKSHE